MPRVSELVDRLHRVFNAHDWDGYRALLDENVELVMSGVAVRGAAAVADFMAVAADTRQGLRVGAQRVFLETEDALVTEVQMIDSSDALTDAGAYQYWVCSLYRAAGGRIVYWHVYLEPGAEASSGAAFAAMASEQSALRRVAEWVARQAPPDEVFSLVTEEIARVLGTRLVRLARIEPDGEHTVLAARGTSTDAIPLGRKMVIPSGTVLEKVLRTGGPARVDDYSKVPGPIGRALREEEGVCCAVGAPIVVDGRIWGVLWAGSQRPETLPPDSEHRVAQFVGLMSAAIANLESRARVEQLAAEQSALRRVAELVARQAPPERVFALVTRELSRLLGVEVVRTLRFEADGGATVVAAQGRPEDRMPPGTTLPIAPGGMLDRLYRTGRPARFEDYTQVAGRTGAMLREEGVRCAAGGPIVVGGRLWGAMLAAASSAEALPPGSEDRIAQFAELVSTAISNLESRAQVERLAAEQSALRRVATLAAREHSPDDLFATLAEEIGVLLGVAGSAVVRYEADASVTVVAGWSDGAITLPIGERLPLAGDSLSGDVRRSGAPRRKEDYSGASGAIADIVRAQGIRCAVASPIVVEGATWGMVAALSREPDTLPPDTEARLAEFSRHAGVAVANAKSRADLAQSRARIVRAGDDARRRFERDLHDGAQQRLVSLRFELRTAEARLTPETSGLGDVFTSLESGLADVLENLRELSRGLHPAVLSEGGLTPALRSLARRSAVPVELRLELDGERFEEPVEVAAYYVASETLANAAKHANASRAEVTARQDGAALELIVRDDGRGGANASAGSGLTGLADRVEAIGGTIEVDSRPGAGTAVHVKLPIGTMAGG